MFGKRRLRWALAALAAILLVGAEAARAQVLTAPGPVTGPARANQGPARPAADGLGEADNPPKAGGEDTVLTLRGDKLVGRIIDIDGALRLEGPQFDGAVRINFDALDRLDLTPRNKEAGRDELTLTNDDRLVGDITAITPEAVVLQSVAAGTLNVARKYVRTAAFWRDQSVLVDSAFSRGQIEPWKAVMGNWAVKDGMLTSSNRPGNLESIYTMAKSAEALTIEAKVESAGGYNLNCDLVLFAENPRKQYGGASVFVMLQEGTFYIQHATGNGGVNSIHSRHLGRSPQSAVLRLAYDPETSKAHFWLDAADLGEYAVPGKLSGPYAMFNSRYPCKVGYLRIMTGVVAPGGAQETGKAEAGGDSIVFANKDRVCGGEISLAEGTFAARTDYGEVRCPVANIRTVTFRTQGQETPRRQKGDALVQTSASRLTLQFGKLTEEFLIGSSEGLGPVKVRRDALKAVQFNLYK